LTAARLIEALANASLARLIPGAEIIKFLISAGISVLARVGAQSELSCDRAALARHARRRTSSGAR
jgi:hypothetical protein